MTEQEKQLRDYAAGCSARIEESDLGVTVVGSPGAVKMVMDWAATNGGFIPTAKLSPFLRDLLKRGKAKADIRVPLGRFIGDTWHAS